jgi:predicted metal-dependent hydrolase
VIQLRDTRTLARRKLDDFVRLAAGLNPLANFVTVDRYFRRRFDPKSHFASGDAQNLHADS